MAAAELFSGRWILVTGASSGIGEAIARVLAARRANLVLTARRRDLLDALARECAGSHGVETRIVTGDLAAPNGVTRVAEAVLALGLPIEHVVNNAGFGMVGRFTDADPARLAEMLRLNCEALTLLSRA